MSYKKTIRKKSKQHFNNLYFQKQPIIIDDELGTAIIKPKINSIINQPTKTFININKTHSKSYLKSTNINSQLISPKRTLSHSRSINNNINYKLIRSKSHQLSQNLNKLSLTPKSNKFKKKIQQNPLYLLQIKAKTKYNSKKTLRKQSKIDKINKICNQINPNLINYQKIQYTSLYITKYINNLPINDDHISEQSESINGIQLKIISPNINEEQKQINDEITSEQNSSISTFKSNQGQRNLWGQIMQKFVSKQSKNSRRVRFKISEKLNHSQLSKNYQYKDNISISQKTNKVLKSQQQTQFHQDEVYDILQNNDVHFNFRKFITQKSSLMWIKRISLHSMKQNNKGIVLIVWIEWKNQILIRSIQWQRKKDKTINFIEKTQVDLCNFTQKSIYQKETQPFIKQFIKKILKFKNKNQHQTENQDQNKLKQKQKRKTLQYHNYYSKRFSQYQLKSEKQVQQLYFKKQKKKQLEFFNKKLEVPEWLNELIELIQKYSFVDKTYLGYKFNKLEDLQNIQKSNKQFIQKNKKQNQIKADLYSIVKLNKTYYLCKCVSNSNFQYPKVYIICDLTSKRVSDKNQDILTNNTIYSYLVNLFFKINYNNGQICEDQFFLFSKCKKSLKMNENKKNIMRQLHKFIISDTFNSNNYNQNTYCEGTIKRVSGYRQTSFIKNEIYELKIKNNSQTQRQKVIDHQKTDWITKQVTYNNKSIKNSFKIHNSFDYGVKINHRHIIQGAFENYEYTVQEFSCQKKRKGISYLVQLMQNNMKYCFMINQQFEKQKFLIFNIPYHLGPILNNFFLKGLFQVYKRKISQRQVFAVKLSQNQQTVKISPNTKQNIIQLIKLSKEASVLQKFTLIKDRSRKVQITINKSVIVLWFCQLRTLRFQKFIFPYHRYKQIMKKFNQKYPQSNLVGQGSQNQLLQFNHLNEIKNMQKFVQMLQFEKKIVYSGYNIKYSCFSIISDLYPLSSFNHDITYNLVNQTLQSNSRYHNSSINYITATDQEFTSNSSFYKNRGIMGKKYNIIYKGTRKLFHGMFILIIVYTLADYGINQIKFYYPLTKKMYISQFQCESNELQNSIQKFVQYLKTQFFAKMIQKENIKIHQRLEKQYNHLINYTNFRLSHIVNKQKNCLEVNNKKNNKLQNLLKTNKLPQVNSRRQKLLKLASLALENSKEENNFQIKQQYWNYFYTSSKNINYYLRLISTTTSKSNEKKDNQCIFQKHITVQIYKNNYWGYLHYNISLNEICQIVYAPKNKQMSEQQLSYYYERKMSKMKYSDWKMLHKKIEQVIIEDHQTLGSVAQRCRQTLNFPNQLNYKKIWIEIDRDYIIEVREKNIFFNNKNNSCFKKHQNSKWINFQWRQSKQNHTIDSWGGSFGSIIPFYKFNMRMFKRLCKDVKKSKLE